MYKVFTGDGRRIVTGSRGLADDFYNAAVRRGHCVMMLMRVAGHKWIEMKEHVI